MANVCVFVQHGPSRPQLLRCTVKNIKLVKLEIIFIMFLFMNEKLCNISCERSFCAHADWTDRIFLTFSSTTLDMMNGYYCCNNMQTNQDGQWNMNKAFVNFFCSLFRWVIADGQDLNLLFLLRVETF